VNYLEFALIVITAWLGLAVGMGKYLAWRWSMKPVHVEHGSTFDQISWN